MPQRWKRGIDAGEVGLCVLDDAAERLEDFAIGVDGLADLGLERNSAEPSPPGDAYSFEIAGEGSRGAGRVLVDRERVVGISAGNDAEKERNVGDSARHRSRDRKRRP